MSRRQKVKRPVSFRIKSKFQNGTFTATLHKPYPNEKSQLGFYIRYPSGAKFKRFVTIYNGAIKLVGSKVVSEVMKYWKSDTSPVTFLSHLVKEVKKVEQELINATSKLYVYQVENTRYDAYSPNSPKGEVYLNVHLPFGKPINLTELFHRLGYKKIESVTFTNYGTYGLFSVVRTNDNVEVIRHDYLPTLSLTKGVAIVVSKGKKVSKVSVFAPFGIIGRSNSLQPNITNREVK